MVNFTSDDPFSMPIALKAGANNLTPGLESTAATPVVQHKVLIVKKRIFNSAFQLEEPPGFCV